jgi:hypothetical protein
MEKQTFEIPKGCSKVTVEQIGNTIVTSFESEKYLPKVGDCVRVTIEDCVYAFEVVATSPCCIWFKICVKIAKGYFIENGFFRNTRNFTKITHEELQSEFNKLGYEYDFETHEATKIKWKPKEGEIYYYVSTGCKVIKAKNNNCYGDIELIKIGNCYRTPEEAEKRRQHYLSFKE